jgi:hypothetical protein
MNFKVLSDVLVAELKFSSALVKWFPLVPGTPLVCFLREVSETIFSISFAIDVARSIARVSVPMRVVGYMNSFHIGVSPIYYPVKL